MLIVLVSGPIRATITDCDIWTSGVLIGQILIGKFSSTKTLGMVTTLAGNFF